MGKVTIIGAGYVGQGWARIFSNSKDWEITIYDIREDLEDLVKDFLPNIDLKYTNDLKDAVKEADFIQENGPENLEMKKSLLLDLIEYSPKTSIIASSTSTILPSEMSENNPGADRIIVGHPFTPSELPVIEIVPGKLTSESTLKAAEEIYKNLNLLPIILKKEIPGFIGNRLQFAVLSEAIYLVQEGVIDPITFDTLVKNATGARYASVGPFESAHLAGGLGGFEYFFDNIFNELSKIQLGKPSFEKSKIQSIISETKEKYGDSSKWKDNIKNRAERTKNIFKSLGKTW